MNLLSVSREVGEFRKRYKWMALAVAVTFLLLLSRVAYLQLIAHDRYAAIAKENIVRTQRLPATRGILRDSVGRVVATNRPSYKMYITPSRVRSRADLEQLAKLLRLDDSELLELEQRVRDVPARRRTHQIEVLSDLKRDQLAALETHEQDLPAVDVVAVPVRTYPYGKLASHAIGYLNEITGDELKEHRDMGYRAGDLVGRSGVERAWEAILRGRRGFRRTYVDARGRRSRLAPPDDDTRMHRDPAPGRDLQLTLDMELMRDVERAFRGHASGAAVVVDVREGKVRALFSKPSYDLNEMSGRLTVDRARELNENPFRPLIDKTVYDSYFPGSTFKPVSALAALGDGIIQPDQHWDCPGFYELGNRRFRCTHVHKETDLRQALVQSCNVYFWKLAELVGMDRLARHAADLGLGSKSGLGINTETPGFIPTRDWYKSKGERFRIGYTLNAAIGQGNTRVTLIQLAMAYASIANGGTLYVPQIVESVNGPDGTPLERFEPRVRRTLEVSPEHLELVAQSLWGVVNDPNGTAYDARQPNGVEVAGKTGTAQVSRSKRRKDDPKRAWYYNRDHAWFAGWAPADAPEVAVAVLVEHGGAGGKQAAPIAIRVLQNYLGNRMAATTLSSGATR